MNDIDQAMQRAQRYWYVDGLNEMAFGLICLSLGVYFYVEATYPKESFLYKLFDLGLVFFIVGAGLLGGRLMGLLKQRITYPRTGYVTYKKATGKYRWMTAGLAMVISALTAGLVISGPASIAWMPAVSGLIFGAVLLYIAARAGLLRFILLSILVVASGMGLSFAGIGDILGLAYFYFLSSLLLLLSGGVTFALYLHNTQPPEGSLE